MSERANSGGEGRFLAVVGPVVLAALILSVAKSLALLTEWLFGVPFGA